MKNIFFALVTIFVGFNCFAGGIGGGGAPGVEAFTMMKPSNLNAIALPSGVKLPDQVYYMRHKQAEIQFATNNAGDNKVEIQSLRPEEISNPVILEGLKRSQQTKQWENLKVPSQVELNRTIQNLNIRW